MNIIITGGSGRLGKELRLVFPDALFPSSSELDITNENSIVSYIKTHSPDMIIHAAAMTDARACEKDPKRAWDTNVEGTRRLIRAFKKSSPEGYFVYISTAGVFKGDSGGYKETDCPNPVNFYCLTKLIGEMIVTGHNNVLIIRTNFVPRGKWPHEKAFTDRFGTYLYPDDVANAIKELIDNTMTGIVHVCGDKKMSMYEIAKIDNPKISSMTAENYDDVNLPRDMSLLTERWHTYKLGGGKVNSITSSRRDDCRICKSKDLVEFLSFGEMPLAGGFIKEDEIKDEKSYPLDVFFCRNCKEVQLLDVVPADTLFKDYRYLSSVTNTLSEHFQEYSKTMKERFNIDSKSLVVEFGSNDGVLQKPFKDIGIISVGVEPAVNVAKIAREKGLTVINDYFNPEVAKGIVERYGKADLITANNCFAHIDNMHEIMESIKILLKEDGVFVFEVHYLVDLIEKCQYDMIYHEHLMYHSIMALSYLFELFGMEIFDVERIPIHSGSIRVYTKNNGNQKYPIEISVVNLINLEKNLGLDREETFKSYASKVLTKRDELIDVVKKLKSGGNRIIGYGASGRASVHLNFCNFGPDEIEYVVDMSPERKGRMMPGVHIPIVDPDILNKDSPNFAIIFAYNYEKEIIEKERDFLERGGKFIVPLPEVRIVP